VKENLSKISHSVVVAIVCGKIYEANGRQNTLVKNITLIWLICIKTEAGKSDYETAAETDVIRTGDTAHKISLTTYR